MPLILPSQRVIRPNPLAYPAGAAPGIDRSHPALAGGNSIIRSVIALGGNLIDIPTAIAGTQALAPTTTADGSLGSVLIGGADVTGATATGQIFPQSITATNGITFAFLTRIPSNLAASTFHYFIMERTGYFFGTTNASPVGKLYLDFYSSGTTINSNIAPALGNPCLLLATTNSSYSFFVIKDLITGKVTTDLQAGTTTPTSTETVTCFSNYTVSNAINGRSYGGPVAAAAIIKGSCTQQALLQFAADPWSFWYPRRTIQYTTPATTTSGGARIRQRWNRSPLAYPAGAVPGIDRSHPAARNCTFSGIATQGGTFGNILSRVQGTENGSKTTSLYSSLGPATNYTAGGSENTIFPFVSAASAPITLAGIFKMTATAVNPAYLLNNSAAGTVGIGDVTPNGTFAGFHENGGTQNVSTGVSYVLGVPYFFAMSFSLTLINWVVARLDTGQVFTGQVANTTGIIDAGDGNITVGSRSGGSRQLGGGIAAAMASNAFMSQQQLLQWAQSPWEFWYPNKTINLSSSAASVGASFLPVWAYRYNLPVLGTGNF